VKRTYILPDGREFHVENRRLPAIFVGDKNIYWMGNSMGVVIGEAAVIPDPSSFPEMVAKADGNVWRLEPEEKWPGLSASVPLVRGVAGGVDKNPAAMQEYLTRLHVMGVL
jgi:hypothetical protein